MADNIKRRSLKKSIKDFMDDETYKKFISLEREHKVKVKNRIQDALNGELKNGIILQLRDVLEKQSDNKPKNLELKESLTFDEIIGLFPSLIPAYEKLQGEYQEVFNEWLKTKLPPYLFAISGRIVEQYYAEETGDISDVQDAKRDVTLSRKQALVPIAGEIKDDSNEIPEELNNFVNELDSRITKVSGFLKELKNQYGSRESLKGNDQNSKQTIFDWSRAEGALRLAQIIKDNLNDIFSSDESRKEFYDASKDLAFDSAKKEKDRIRGAGIAAGILAVAEFVASFFDDSEESELEKQEDRVEEPVEDEIDVDNTEIPSITNVDSKDRLQSTDDSPNLDIIGNEEVPEYVQQAVEEKLAQDQKKIFDVVDKLRKNKVIDTVLQRTSPVKSSSDSGRINAKKHFIEQADNLVKALFDPEQGNIVTMFKELKDFVEEKISRYLINSQEKQERYEQRIISLEKDLETKNINKEKQIKMKRRLNSAKRSLRNLKFIIEFLPETIEDLNLNINEKSLEIANELRADNDLEKINPEPTEGDRELSAKADAENAESISSSTGEEEPEEVEAAIKANQEEPEEELDDPDTTLDESDPEVLKLYGGTSRNPVEMLLQRDDQYLTVELFKNGNWKLFPKQDREKVSRFLQQNHFDLGEFNKWLVGEPEQEDGDDDELI